VVLNDNHLGACLTKAAGQGMGDGINAATMGNDHLALMKVPGGASEPLTFAHPCHSRGSINTVAETLQVVQRGWPAHAINGKAAVSLEFPQGPLGVRPEDPVNPTGVESQPSQTLLELGNVVAPCHGVGEVEQSVTQFEPGLNQGGPGGSVA
jgi:hypothetical protein